MATQTNIKKKTVTKKAVSTKPAKTARKEQHIYEFGKKTDGNATMKALLGGKGANLAEMSRIKLPVPPGFTITTKVCNFFSESKGKMFGGGKLTASPTERLRCAKWQQSGFSGCGRRCIFAQPFCQPRL